MVPWGVVTAGRPRSRPNISLVDRPVSRESMWMLAVAHVHVLIKPGTARAVINAGGQTSAQWAGLD